MSTRKVPRYLSHKDGELHFDTRKFLEDQGLPLPEENERWVVEMFKKVAREMWGDIETVETDAPMPRAER